MDRRTFLATAAGALLIPPAVYGQQPSAHYRVGILSTDTAHDFRVVEIRAGLQDLGYKEGENLEVDFRWVDGDLARLSSLAEELVASKVDVIVTVGAAVWAAKRATTTVPIVVAFSGDLLSVGLVSDMARPGGNITGLSLLSTDLAAKRLALLKEAIPQIVRVATLYDPDEVATAPELQETETAASSLSVKLQRVEVRLADELEAGFAAMDRERADAMMVFAHGYAYRNRARIIALAGQHRLPAMYGWRQFVDAGGLMSYGPNVKGVVRRAAIYVDRILKGSRPGDLAVEQPTRFELVINMRAAKALGLTMPQALLLRADEVIQ